ncbi:hypothetical protein [Aureimonas sp. ME7]|uniref:hypothetical protein n=1 Tax=Aureimonas sp. ME7 TaxID=2744252 RepID=UPI0015F48464|nr:hypothetical protein [Aureimonas sp. ME7]
MTVVESSSSLDTRPRPPLGVFAILGRSFGLIRGAFLPLVGVCFLYSLAIQIGGFGIGLWLANRGIQLGTVEQAAETGFSAIQIVLFVLLGLVLTIVFSAFSGAIFHVALKRDAGERTSAGKAIGVGFRFMLPMFLCFILVSLLIAAGLVALVVPGVWLAGVYGLAPVVMIGDDRARGVLGRTRRLSKDYRWPLVGLFALLYLVLIAISMIVGLFAVLVPADFSNTTTVLLRYLLLDAPVSAVTTALFVAVCAVAYHRLVAIKDGDGSEALRTVFE